MQNITLSEALLRRKELNEKVKQLNQFKVQDFYEVRSKRVKAHEGIDEVTAQIPKISVNEVTAAYDRAARSLRLIDAAIQRANHTTTLSIDDTIMEDYTPPTKAA